MLESIIARRIKEQMAAKGWDEKKLARLSNTNIGTLRCLLKSETHHPSVWTVAKIAAVLGVRIEELLS